MSLRGVHKIAIAGAVVLAFAIAFAVTPPRGPRSMRHFNPDRLADLEVRMWQAYYAKERVRLFALLVTMLHEQYRYSWATATKEAFHLARAAATFGDAKCGGNGSRPDPCRPPSPILGDLETAYEMARAWV